MNAASLGRRDFCPSCRELLGDLIGVQLTHIRTRGTPPALIDDVSTGQVPFMLISSLPQSRSPMLVS